MINIYLERCRGKEYCKTDEEIDKFFTGKFLMILANQIRFDARKYHEPAIVFDSRV